MDNLQDKMDEGAKAIRSMIRTAIKAADSLCEAGNAKGSADAWEMAARLCHVMAHGRSLAIDLDGGVIAPAFGGGK